MLIILEEPMSKELFQAIHDNDRTQVEQLIASNRAVAVARNESGVSALMQARYEGRREILDVLRQSAGELDVFEAATLGDVPQLRKLLKANPALAHAFSADGFTALHLAAFFAQPEAAEELLHQGADANAVTKNSMKVAVVNSAAASGRADLVKRVLRAGADPNARQQMGYTALHAAAAHDNVEMAQALLDAGADPSLKSDDGQTAAEKAGAAVAAMLGSKAQQT
jgi:ankyrin repeat protein